MRDINYRLEQLLDDFRNVHQFIETSDSVTQQKLRDGERDIHALAFLSNAAVEFLELSPEDDIYLFIAKKLYKLADNCIIFINSFDTASNTMTVQAILGIGEKTRGLLKILGRHPVGMSLEISPEAKSGLSTAKLEKVPGGIYEFSFRKIPKAICDAIEKLFNVGDIYAIGFFWKGQLYGSASFLVRSGTDLEDKELLETFVKQASIVLQRWHAEEALRKAYDELEIRVGERTKELAKANEQLTKEIAERAKTEEELRGNEKKYRSLFENISDAVTIIDSFGLLRYLSPSAEKLLGYEREELIGKSAFDFVHPDDLPNVLNIYHQGIQIPGYTARIEYRLRHKDGSWRDFEVIGRNLLQEPAVAGIVITYHDVTERKNAESKLEQSKKELWRLFDLEKREREELQKEQEARATFLSTLAHELRTPLTPIMVSAGLIKEMAVSAADSQQTKLVDLVLDGAKTLAYRLEELLDLAQFVIGTFALEYELINFKSLVEENITKCQSAAEGKNLSLILDIPASLPDVKADRYNVNRVLDNLLSNAIKLSPERGSVTIKVRTSGSELIVEVEDQGSGLSYEEQERIFQPYHRVEQDRQRFSGLGLGLAVSRQIIEAHGGKIWVRSRLGRGSTFGFSLPLKNH